MMAPSLWFRDDEDGGFISRLRNDEEDDLSFVQL